LKLGITRLSNPKALTGGGGPGSVPGTFRNFFPLKALTRLLI